MWRSNCDKYFCQILSVVIGSFAKKCHTIAAHHHDPTILSPQSSSEPTRRDVFEGMKAYAKNQQLPRMVTFNGLMWRILRHNERNPCLEVISRLGNDRLAICLKGTKPPGLLEFEVMIHSFASLHDSVDEQRNAAKFPMGNGKKIMFAVRS